MTSSAPRPEFDGIADAVLGFRRRCGWCGVCLRAWQLNLCRMCRRAVRYDKASPPCGSLARAEEWPDGLGPRRR